MSEIELEAGAAPLQNADKPAPVALSAEELEKQLMQPQQPVDTKHSNLDVEFEKKLKLSKDDQTEEEDLFNFLQNESAKAVPVEEPVQEVESPTEPTLNHPGIPATQPHTTQEALLLQQA